MIKYNLNGLTSIKESCGLDLLISNDEVQVWACLDRDNDYFGQVEVLHPSDKDESGWLPYYYYDFLNPDCEIKKYKLNWVKEEVEEDE